YHFQVFLQLMLATDCTYSVRAQGLATTGVCTDRDGAKAEERPACPEFLARGLSVLPDDPHHGGLLRHAGESPQKGRCRPAALAGADDPGRQEPEHHG